MKSNGGFEKALREGVLIFDGAMGTEIYKHNILTNRCFDELCLSEPDIIRAIHVAYCNAGADVLTTNSFGANRLTLNKSGLGERTQAINAAAVALAREVAGKADRPVYVAGSVGPVLRESPDDDVLGALREQAGSMIEAGVDALFFETLPTRESAEDCAEAMTTWPGFPFVLSYRVFDDCESASGELLARLLAPLPEGMPMPVAWGMNCGVGPDALLTATEQAIGLVDLPLIVQPNAGKPKEVSGRQLLFCTPDYLAGYAKRYLDLGVHGIGGCCGTTPGHIKEIAQRIKPLARHFYKVAAIVLAPETQVREATPFEHKSRLAWRLANGKWVTSVEIIPPRGYDLHETIEKAKTLHHHGVDAVNIPDGPRASSRLSPLITSQQLQRESQIEVILHFCCRDRNLIGMQADLLACAACEIHNILFVTGDPPKLGNYPFASGVFDMDSIGLCGVQKRLNQGIDLGGQPIDPQTHTAIGVGADPTALDFEREIRRFQQKVEAGAEFAITQPVFDLAAIFRFLDRVAHLNVPVIAGIWPLASYRNAQFLRNEVPGVIVPDGIMERMAAVTSKEDQRRVGIEIAREAIDQMRDRVAGVQISPPFGNVQTALAVIE
ncbi:MAG: bifunctional homocysteine S-methyltransferase/methylenetetrahydrofolate reductase [Candidatus Hydrogenedentes bacterium]|nr:bifunctional homocysteine S-methyltransferase/methylenetetrahydrofolate reductase [Candidatus Hydrogenedentota bacterium]